MAPEVSRAQAAVEFAELLEMLRTGPSVLKISPYFGMDKIGILPVPSSPYEFLPQHLTLESEVLAQVVV